MRNHIYNNRKTLNFLPLVFVLCVTAVAPGQQPVADKGLPNFHQVNKTLYRGGQPKKGRMKKLSEMGIKTVINLRDDDDNAQREEAEAQAAGLRYFNIPMATFERPEDRTVEQALSLINAQENQPVFVHCRRGSDRTGTIIAIYRIELEGWTSEQAKAEAKHYGMGFWQVGMKDYISDYYKRRLENLSEKRRMRYHAMGQ